jgi:hypothetical protein
MRYLKRAVAGVLILIVLAALAMPILAAETKGRITKVRPEKNEFVLTENVKDLTFQLNKDGKVFINDKESKLADLRAGDEAMVTYTRIGQQLNASVIRCVRK